MLRTANRRRRWPRVCRAWHIAYGVRVPVPGISGAEGKERARASSRGGVWRKPNPKTRGDEQEPDTRLGTLGASGHVTIKPSIHSLSVCGKSGVHVSKAMCLTPGGLLCALGSRVRRNLAERRVIGADRTAEVSSGRSRRVTSRRGMPCPVNVREPDGLTTPKARTV